MTLGRCAGPRAAAPDRARSVICYAVPTRAARPRARPWNTTASPSDGLPDEGFKAILGTDMAPEKVANPLTAMGVRRWIVELPRPGERGPGRLILNPTREETEGYVMLPMSAPFSKMQGGGLGTTPLPGCLQPGSTGRTAAGRGCAGRCCWTPALVVPVGAERAAARALVGGGEGGCAGVLRSARRRSGAPRDDAGRLARAGDAADLAPGAARARPGA